jgi:hypothetical protein
VSQSQRVFHCMRTAWSIGVSEGHVRSLTTPVLPLKSGANSPFPTVDLWNQTRSEAG